MPKRKSVLDLLLHRPPLTLSPLAINAPVPEASLSPEPSLKQFIGFHHIRRNYATWTSINTSCVRRLKRIPTFADV
ncbi:hypothetical protein DTO013E5_8673 [Penicillium roqueforti]|uniref:uncharacterized protein n=1 Tax=Penicillium roqueforti TaxID=5082 RepID=UPI00190C97AC|nr:uncharacterized protein LCP9604111_3964 [Penicillium roqueforti]KAF9249864.1 hypothetical protein LCP9604111_3964 [Penicillium roqueforti]KAI1830487.1 hypothetical protein CBS147337_8761 [Penicillium roqueforti]KAI2673703.1 hypothetical protein CBS147355_7462 [Penicillium roqueforti]KAI2684914.1 hypothetical protein LCP963914a_5006 [Penicillium roqueforti]KAI2697146.1 hypothetical protein CBS147372_7884 [Penicillium roqueforti]